MNVVHLVSYLDNQTGGMERQALQLGKRLKNRGHSVIFITCAHLTTMLRDNLSWKGELEGIRVFRVPLIKGLGSGNSFLYLLGALLLLIILRKRYDLIHAHQMYTSGLVACFARLFLRSKKVIIKNCAGGSICGDIANLKRLLLSGYLIGFIRKQADRIVCVSAETANEVKQAGLNGWVIISNGVDTESFFPATQKTKEDLRRKMGIRTEQKHIVLFVGRLSLEKNLPVLLESLRYLGRDVRLLIVGKGPCRDELGILAKQSGLGESVIFIGETDRVVDFYQVADLLVLPSKSEGMPNVLLEAMSCGLVCIGSNIPGIESVITDGKEGFLFEGFNAISLAEKIGSVFSDPVLAAEVSRNARKSVEEKFDFKMIAAVYGSLYEEIREGTGRFQKHI